MKKTFIASAVAAIVLPAVIMAAPGHGGKHGDRMINHMSEKLELTAEQKTQVESLFQEQHEKRKALREETHARLNDILNDEQQTKFEQMRTERKQRWQEKREQWKQKRQQETSQTQ